MERLFDANCQARLSEMSQRHQHANPAFSINMLSMQLLVDTYLKYIHRYYTVKNINARFNVIKNNRMRALVEN